MSLSLFALITYLAATMMASMAAAQRKMSTRDRVQEVAVSCLYRISHEVRTANKWIAPANGTAALADFESPDWEQDSTLFPEPVPGNVTGIPLYVPGAPATQMRIVYKVTGGQLVRELTAANSTWTTPILNEVGSFSVTRALPDRIKVDMAVNLPEGVKLFSITAMTPRFPWNPQP